ncbi:MAG: hypothetical protein GDYSWBUE_000832 [Candidatus Fervidibacterota bacterium]
MYSITALLNRSCLRSEETRAASLGAAVVVGLVNGGIKDAATSLDTWQCHDVYTMLLQDQNLKSLHTAFCGWLIG